GVLVKEKTSCYLLEEEESSIQRKILDSFNTSEFPAPVSNCCLAGLYSYEYGRYLHGLISNAEFTSPAWILACYNTYYFYNIQTRTKTCIQLNYKIPGKILRKNSKFNFNKNFKLQNPISSENENTYIQKVKKVKDYIRSGNVYELNLSRKIEAEFSGSPISLFLKLYQINPAPFSAYFLLEEECVVSNSPESFLYAEGKKIETRPIKGTIQRANKKKKDKANRRSLYFSQKDQAELYMIIDLLRNDLGKVSKFASVKVKKRKKMESFANVHHLLGVIEGILKQEYSYIDLLLACLPGGSITGCPKKRCMEIIHEIENLERGIYTGSIAYFNKTSLVSNILIRTAYLKNSTCSFHTGGAITIESEPEGEYRETIYKANSFNKLFSVSD
ncbi:MAG: anthranilate synthase component I family protein, partial [Leptospiraceae bacterium]|nr:anthranilate synthase component I family protein [Leptospiraceae bacterium]